MWKLKVYGGNFRGTHRAIMATTSLTAFCETTGISREYAYETGNPEEIAVAMNAPGAMFALPMSGPDRKRWLRRCLACGRLRPAETVTDDECVDCSH